MYSIVLMAALSAGATEPGCHRGGCGCAGYYSCGGCYGGCYGAGWGGYYGSCGGYGGCYGGCGGYGYGCAGYGCYGAGWGMTNYAPAYIAPAPVGDKPEVVPAPKVKPKKEDDTSLNDQARLIIAVPTDARLFIDNQPMRTTSATRVFRTPKLDRTQTYYYDVRMEVVREGKTVSRTQRVILRAGQEVHTAFADMPATKTDATAIAR